MHRLQIPAIRLQIPATRLQIPALTTTNFSYYDYKFRLLSTGQPPPDRLASTLCKTANDYKFRLCASGVCRSRKSSLRKPFYRLQIPAMAPLVAFVRCLAKVTFGNPFPRNCVFRVTTTNSGHGSLISNDYRFRLWPMALLSTTNSGYENGRRNFSPKLVTIDSLPRQD